MRRLLLVVAAVLGLLAVALPAGAESDLVDRYEQLRSTAKLTLTPDGHSSLGDITGGFVTLDPLGNVVSQRSFVPKPLDGFTAQGFDGFPCLTDSRSPFLTTYDPTIIPINEKNEKGAFRFFPYSLDNARQGPNKDMRVQFLICGVGGIDGQNGSRIDVSGPGMAYNDPDRPALLGSQWREGKTPKDYTITLGFQATGQGGNVNGSITQNPANYLKGSVVPPYGGHPFEKLSVNAVNAWWEDGCRPRCRRWNGSADYQGSVGEGMWEFPQATKNDALQHGFLVAPYYEHFCGNPFGC
jgi:hypothetical protein